MVGSLLVLALAAAAPNPHAPERRPVVLDFRPGADNPVPLLPAPDSGPRFSDLAAYEGLPVIEKEPGVLPEGWVQVGGMVVPAAPARADSPWPLAAAPEIAADKVEGPDAQDLCAFPDAVPAGIYPGEFRRGAEYPRRGTIYMNYTGGVLYNGMGDNSAENWSALAKTGSQYPVYTGGEDRAIAVAQAVQADFADWALRVVYLERPPKLLPYVMIMMGGHYSDTVAGPSGGVAPGADCEDIGLRNVCFAFVNNDSVTTQSNIASQEIGHTMGLGHTEGNDRVMAFGYDTYAPVDMGFGAECTPIITVQGQAVHCSGVNKCHCNDGNLQHDKATLAAIYAPAGPDIVPPEITITEPADGAVLAAGQDVVVRFEPWDDYGGYGWKLEVRSEGKLLAEVVDYLAMLEFTLQNLPEGTYELKAVVQDHADQVGTHTITIKVAGESGSTTGEDPTGGPTTGATTGSTGADTADTAQSGETGDSQTSGMSSSDDGCACRGTGAPGLPMLAALAFRRRRRGRR